MERAEAEAILDGGRETAVALLMRGLDETRRSDGVLSSRGTVPAFPYIGLRPQAVLAMKSLQMGRRGRCEPYLARKALVGSWCAKRRCRQPTVRRDPTKRAALGVAAARSSSLCPCRSV